ncbi:MAG: hypothetical protein NT010_10605 [Proteobacteria bacterium]|nr:hypothetical protein [Pseudomonadota bacterium]
MKFKSFILMIVILIISLFLSGTARADYLTVGGAPNGYGPYQYDRGGEFTFTPDTGLNWILSNYHENAKYGNAFQTFCIEENEYVYPSTTYSVILGNAAIKGGQGGPSDPLSKGTAWLYYQFSQNTLTGYNYAPTGRTGSADALQKTIWWLEGEASDPGIGNTFRNNVIAQFASSTEAKKDNFDVSTQTRSYPVMVVTLWVKDHAGDLSDNGYYLRQDMLATVPVPPGVYLLGAGLIGVVFIRKRINKV